MEIKFGTSGWRDIIADGFTFQNVRICTQAIAENLINEKQVREVIIGSDTRFMSSKFMSLAAGVFAGNGIKVYLCVRDTPTPVISFEILRRKTGGAVNFTASHNPPEYQGMKFSPAWGGPALPVTTTDIEKRANRIMKNSEKINELDFAEAEKKGLIERIDPMDGYLNDLKKKIDLKKIGSSGLKILINPLYGTSRGYLDRILREAGCNVTVMNDNLDPYFGGKAPEPSEKEIGDMIERMKKEDFDIGLATDGDADRFGILAKGGVFFQPNQILGMVLDHLKKTRSWTGGVGRSVATTHFIDEVAKYHNIPVIQTPVGFKFIGDLIAQDKIILGGEESAGLTIKGHVPEKDGIIACLLVAEMVAMEKKSLGTILEDLYKKVGYYHTCRLNFHLTQQQKTTVMEKLKTDPKDIAGLKLKEVVKIDGTKYILENDSWILIRLSGTEPVARYYAEAKDLNTLETLKKFGAEFMNS
ncbi:MAG: phosphoglucomutase/phosphomannomutase family protein [Candidatus Riflebacteria bacterium]|nr:phosphoglucomutase/phosphomannomutase family protein [Candidatus Riflebacteria bacterium]